MQPEYFDILGRQGLKVHYLLSVALLIERFQIILHAMKLNYCSFIFIRICYVCKFRMRLNNYKSAHKSFKTKKRETQKLFHGRFIQDDHEGKDD